MWYPPARVPRPCRHCEGSVRHAIIVYGGANLCKESARREWLCQEAVVTARGGGDIGAGIAREVEHGSAPSPAPHALVEGVPGHVRGGRYPQQGSAGRAHPVPRSRSTASAPLPAFRTEYPEADRIAATSPRTAGSSSTEDQLAAASCRGSGLRARIGNQCVANAGEVDAEGRALADAALHVDEAVALVHDA